MAVKNVGGHAVTDTLGQSDHTVATPAQPTFQDDSVTGPARRRGSSDAKKAFPPSV